MAAQLSWNLDHTSTSAIQVAKGILHAATTDNVQPLAIMACEQFGNTLAMSPDTVRKIEHSVVPTPQPAILTFIKSTIGYSANDCTSYLGKSLAGLQFLGLAAALVICKDTFKTAEALQSMLVSTAGDKTLVPTVRQVKDLLVSIEPRCHRSGFADDVAGWQLLLARQPAPAWFKEASALRKGTYAPGKQALVNLVDALRQLNRVGTADIARVTVKTTSCAAWTIAFIKWSLGCPPSVILGNASVPIIEQPGSRVTVIIDTAKEENQDFSTTIYSTIHGPSNLVVPTQGEATVGMVCLETYGKLLLLRCEFDSGLEREAFREAIPYSLHKAVELLSQSFMHTSGHWLFGSTNFFVPGPSGQKERQRSPLTDLEAALKLSPFRGESAISKIYELLFSESLNPISPKNEVDISDLPHVALLRRRCQCLSCHSNPETCLFGDCDLVGFYTYLGRIVLDVLALSLVECPDLLQVSSDAIFNYGFEDGFLREIIGDLRNENGINGGVSELFHRAMRILGHDRNETIGKDWVMSSAKGQAVWPTIYESQSYGRKGYLSLSWHPGLLSYKDDFYELANCPRRKWPTAGSPRNDPITGIRKDKVQRPCNLFPKIKLDWTVSAAEHSLHVTLGVWNVPIRHQFMGLNPFTSLVTLANALLVEHCQHNANAELESSDLLLRFTGPICPLDPDAGVSVVAVDCDNRLRFIALASLGVSTGVVLRKGACLACCLEVCQKTGSKVLIL